MWALWLMGEVTCYELWALWLDNDYRTIQSEWQGNNLLAVPVFLYSDIYKLLFSTIIITFTVP